MNKRIISILLTILFLCKITPTYGLTKSDKHIIIGTGCTVAIAVPVLWFLIKFCGNSGVNSGINNGIVDGKDIHGWEDVSKWYNLAAEYEKSKNGETAEYYEHLADSDRCILILQERKKEETYLSMCKNFKNASKLYTKIAKLCEERAKLYEGGAEEYKSEYDSYQLNSAKAAEMLAKEEECTVNYGMEFICGACVDENGQIQFPNRRPLCAELWGKVIGKKDSYNSYANAKQLEYSDKGYEEIADAWSAVMNDSVLKESFKTKTNSEAPWEAFQAFAEANCEKWLLACNQSTKEKVHNAWMKAYKKDRVCAKSCFIYNAFAAEAYQMAQDALKQDQ